MPNSLTPIIESLATVFEPFVQPIDEKLELGIADYRYNFHQMGLLVPWLGGAKLQPWHLSCDRQYTAFSLWLAAGEPGGFILRVFNTGDFIQDFYSLPDPFQKTVYPPVFYYGFAANTLFYPFCVCVI